MIPLLAPLISAGMSILTGAIKAKGQDAVEKVIGMKIPKDPTNDDLFKLKQLEAKHEEELLKLSIEVKKLDLEMAKVEVEGEKSENEAITARWSADMGSDSWLSKNIRPIGMLASLAFVLLVIGMNVFGVVVQESVANMVEMLATAYAMAYVGGRTVEKAMSIRRRK